MDNRQMISTWVSRHCLMWLRHQVMTFITENMLMKKTLSKARKKTSEISTLCRSIQFKDVARSAVTMVSQLSKKKAPTVATPSVNVLLSF